MDDILDVLVVGGGPVGACLAALLTRMSAQGASPFKVAVLEPKPPDLPGPEEPLDSRVVAASRASERVLDAAGAWSDIIGPRVCSYERMRVWHESVAPTSREALVFDAADVGEPNLGYIVESRLVQAAVLQAFARSGGRIERTPLAGVRITEDYAQVTTGVGELKARLVVGADGARSAVREAVGLTVESTDYGQIAVVANIRTQRSHQNTAWQRFMSTGTLAFLPLADGRSSIVWSADQKEAAALLAAPEVDFVAALDSASDLALGPTALDGERLSFPLQRLAAHHYVAHRCALIGDAAHVVHPLAGQGVNLGLLDAAALVDVLLEGRAQREDPGALRTLRRYERWRKAEVALMSAAIDSFDRFLAHGSGPLSRLARRGLAWVNRSQELKGLFIRRALGLTGELPLAARAIR